MIPSLGSKRVRLPKLSNVLIAIGLVIFFWGGTAIISDFGDGLSPDHIHEQADPDPSATPKPGLFSTAVLMPEKGSPREDDLDEDGFTVYSKYPIAATLSEIIPITGTVYQPDRIRIPKIFLDAPVIEAAHKVVTVEGQRFVQWLAPDALAVGWHTSSAPLGVPGNTVLNGHHNAWGNVFGRLIDLEVDDTIVVSSGTMDFVYKIANKMILQETYAELEVREENALWLQPSDDERLTLVTCWPVDSNTHRLIIVAKPVTSGENIPEFDR